MTSRLPLAVALAALLAGCVASPTRPTDDDALPSAWQALPLTADETRAWRGLGDAPLEALQARALAANLDLRQAALRLLKAQRQVTATERRVEPVVDLGAQRTRTLEPDAATTTAFSLSARASFEPDLWDRLAATTAAARADAQAVQTDIAAARAALLAEVASRYWSLAAIAARRATLDERLRNEREIVAIVRLRVAEGKELPIEIDKAASQLQAVLNEQAGMDADARLARNALAVLLDLPLPGAEVADARLPADAAPGWRLATPAEALAQRPDVQRARLAVDAALARLHVAQAERYPRLQFTANAGSGGPRARDLFEEPLLSLLANLTVPLVDWQRLERQRDDARSDLDSAALALRDTVHKALQDIEAQRIERERIEADRIAAALRWRDANEAARLAGLRYELGTIGRVDWLRARNAVLAAEQEQVGLAARRWLNHAAMARALGRADWSATVPAP